VTGFGHSFTGLSIGLLCMPPAWRRRKKLGLLALTVGLANLPDLPVPGWGHHSYHISHSLFVNLGLILAAAVGLAAWRRAREVLGGWRVIAGLTAAWLSHFLLDSFYNHGRGVKIYWPLSDASLDLALPWFSVLPGWQTDAAVLRIFGVEILFYGVLLLLCFVARQLWLRSRG
jgi:hypothetical protein